LTRAGWIRSHSRTRSQVENFRDRQIRKLVAHAYANVPFYRRLYDAHGISPGKVRGYGDLPMLPLATRAELQRTAASDLIARGVDQQRLRVRQTTGTTGEPLLVRRTSAESTLLQLFRFQLFRKLGVRRTDLSVGIRLPRPASVHSHVGLSRRIANRVGFYPRAALVAENPTQVLKDLNQLSPAILGGVPGLLSAIAARWPAKTIEEIRSAKWPRLVVTSGERLTPSVRNHLRDVFGTRVVDMYTTEEFHLIAYECPEAGSYHVSDETVALEVIDGARSAMPGETGQPVGTALHSFAAPLIRYALDDVVPMGGTQCDCEFPRSTIKEIQGRVMHYMEFPDGLILHHAKIEQAVGLAAPWVRQTQTAQSRIDVLVLRVAPMRDPSAEEIDTLRSSLETYLNDRVTVEVVIDHDLGPEDGEKFRSLVAPQAQSWA
jgi:phenylacetate-CoA ligase